MIIYRYLLKHTLQNKIHVSQPWFVETLPEKKNTRFSCRLGLVLYLGINIFHINFDGEGKNEKFQRIFHNYDLASVVQKVNSAIQWRMQLVSLILIHLIVIYPMDSAIQLLNN